MEGNFVFLDIKLDSFIDFHFLDKPEQYFYILPNWPIWSTELGMQL